MTRKREFNPHSYYHVSMRGNNRQPIFQTKEDMFELKRALLHVHADYPFTILAYCFMTNHYHLLIKAERDPLHKIMCLVNRRHSASYAKRYRHVGRIYQKRYFAKEVDSRLGLLTVSSYIHRNPIETEVPMVARLMKEMNLVCRIRKVKVSRETQTNLAGHVYTNLLNWDFNALLPNTKWVMDLSEIKVQHEKIFISAIVDLFNRELIAVVLGSRSSYELVEATLTTAMAERRIEKMTGTLIHTDRESHFTSYQHRQQSKALEFIPSISRRANCWDNAVMESVFSHYKTEFELHYPMNHDTQVKIDLLLFRVYFNEEKSQKRLGHKTSKAFLEAHLQF